MSYQYGDLPPGWELEILAGIGAPATASNVKFLDAWNQAEKPPGGGGPDTFNPFNTTLGEPGSYGTNSANVQAYPDWTTGLRATVSTLSESAYGGLVGLLRGGTATPQQLGSSPNLITWGTGEFNPSNYITTPSNANTGTGSVICGIPIFGGLACGVGNSVSGAASSAAGGAASTIQQAGGSALGWIGKWFGKWLVLIGIGLAMLLVIGALARGEEAETIRRAVHA